MRSRRGRPRPTAAGTPGRLGPLAVAVERVGGPAGGWNLDRVTACVAQARGRFAEAAAAHGCERMRRTDRHRRPGLQLLGDAAPTSPPRSVGIEIEHSWVR